MLDVPPDSPERPQPEPEPNNSHDLGDSDYSELKEGKQEKEPKDCVDYIEGLYRACNWFLRLPVTIFFCFAYLFNNAGERLRQGQKGRNCTKLPTIFLFYFVFLILYALYNRALERTVGAGGKGRLTHLAFSCVFLIIGCYFLWILCEVINDWSKLLRDAECMTTVHKEGGVVFWVAGILLGVQMAWYLVTFIIGMVLLIVAICCCQTCLEDWIVIEHDTSRAPLLTG